jgi:hypothetical protein
VSATWGDLRAATPGVRAPVWCPFEDGLCHDKVWVVDRLGRTTGRVECREQAHTSSTPCRSAMYQWRKGSFRIVGYGWADREHDPRRKA